MSLEYEGQPITKLMYEGTNILASQSGIESDFPGYAVEFDGNGATEGTMPDLLLWEVGVQNTLPANTYKKKQHKYLGWVGSDGLSYTDEDTVDGTGMNARVLTLTADWEYQEKYTHDTAAEWAANVEEIKAAAEDLSENGTGSVYYEEFAAFMAADATFPFPLRNVDSWTSVAADKVMNCRIVGINCKDKADGSGKAGLTFMAKHAHPKASVINTSNSTSGGYPSMPIRTYLNSGDFWNSLPADLQSAIVQVTNKSRGPSGQVTSSDKLWLPSWYELCGSDSSSSYQTNDGPQFPWFATKGTTNSAVQSTLANMYKTNRGAQPSGLDDAFFWTRSVYPGGTNRFVFARSDGSHGYSYPSYAYSVLPCFSL